MGGYGSGRTQRRDCTDDYVRLDVRWLKRQGYLRPGWSGMVHWSRRGARFACVNIEAADDQSPSDTEPVREATNGSTNTTRLPLNGRLAPWEEIAHGSNVPRVAVVRRSCMVRRCSHVGIASNSLMSHSGKLRTTAHCIRRKASTRN